MAKTLDYAAKKYERKAKKGWEKFWKARTLASVDDYKNGIVAFGVPAEVAGILAENFREGVNGVDVAQVLSKISADRYKKGYEKLRAVLA